MPIVEIEESITDMGFDKLKPKADQTKYQSRFAVVGKHGAVEGFFGEGESKERQRVGQTGVFMSGWERFHDKDGQPNIIKHDGIRVNGMDLVEMIRPIEDNEIQSRVEGMDSNGRIDGHITATKANLERLGIRPLRGENEIADTPLGHFSGLEDAIPGQEKISSPVKASMTTPTSKSRAWTPERKAAQAEIMRKRHAAKHEQPNQT